MPPSLSATLASHQCVRLRVEGRFLIGVEADGPLVQFMEQSSHFGLSTPEGSRITRQMRLGALLKGDDGHYAVSGRLNRTPREDGVRVTLWLTVEKHSGVGVRPPRGYHPAFRLLHAAKRLFGQQDFTCTVEFAYDSDQGVQSIVPLPMAFFLPTSAGVTHIESAMFSRRTPQGVEHTVVVIPAEDDAPLLHIVGFQEVFALTRATIGRVIRKGRSLSANLLEEGEDSNG